MVTANIFEGQSQELSVQSPILWKLIIWICMFDHLYCDVYIKDKFVDYLWCNSKNLLDNKWTVVFNVVWYTPICISFWNVNWCIHFLDFFFWISKWYVMTSVLPIDRLRSYSIRQCNIDGLVQDCSNSIANALELLQSCTKPSTWYCMQQKNDLIKLSTNKRHSIAQPYGW